MTRRRDRTVYTSWSDKPETMASGYYVHNERGGELAGPFGSPDGAGAFAAAFQAEGWACLLPRWWREAYREGRLDERGREIPRKRKRKPT